MKKHKFLFILQLFIVILTSCKSIEVYSVGKNPIDHSFKSSNLTKQESGTLLYLNTIQYTGNWLSRYLKLYPEELTYNPSTTEIICQGDIIPLSENYMFFRLFSIA